MSQPEEALTALSVQFPDYPREVLEKTIDAQQYDGVVNVQTCIDALHKFGYDGDDSRAPTRTQARRKATVWRQPGSGTLQRGVTFHSKTKAGFDDSDIFTDAGDDTEDEDAQETIDSDDEIRDLFNIMFTALDAVAGEVNSENSVTSTISLSEAATGEYMEIENLEDNEDEGVADLINRASILFPDVEKDDIEASLKTSEYDLSAVCYDLMKDLAPEAQPTSPSVTQRDLLRNLAMGTSLSASSVSFDATSWKSRQEIVSSGLLSELSEKEIKRQESIAELAQSEDAYLKDVTVLLDVLLLPMLQASIAGDPIDDTIPHDTIRSMAESGELLKKSGEQFLAALRARQAEALVVVSVGDIILEHIPRLRAAFSSYCSTCFYLQSHFQHPTAELKALLKRASADARCRSLPASAFVLAPIQRVARYPLLVQAIGDRTAGDNTADTLALIQAQSQVRDVAQLCNTRLRSLEDHAIMVDLSNRLDTSRLQDPLPLVHSDRALIKRGRLTAVKLTDKQKISKSKRMEIMLFTDMLVYAKPLEHGKKFLVYKQIHRALVEARAFDGSTDKGKGTAKKATAATKDSDKLIELLLYGEGSSTFKLYFLCASRSERDRWLEAFTPQLEDEEQQFADYDCPQGRVVQDYDARQQDELTLRRGDLINIINRGGSDGEEHASMYKGVIVGVLHATHRQTKGWFPRQHIKELITTHTHAKVLKAQYKLTSGSMRLEAKNL
eukprot:m.116350 g.116350  ORF g.116350 m.116350 type:complete len:727 (-) comp17177_c0_seq3:227-2407(-)